MRRNIFQLYLNRHHAHKPALLLEIPAELLSKIILFALFPNNSSSRPSRDLHTPEVIYSKERYSNTDLAILRVCKQTYTEARALLYSKYCFEVGSETLNRLFRAEEHLSRSYLANLEFVRHVHLFSPVVIYKHMPECPLKHLERFTGLRSLHITFQGSLLWQQGLYHYQAIRRRKVMAFYKQAVGYLCQHIRVEKAVIRFEKLGNEREIIPVAKAIEEVIMGKPCLLLSNMCEIDISGLERALLMSNDIPFP